MVWHLVPDQNLNLFLLKMQGRNLHPIETPKFLPCFADHHLAHKRGQDYSDNCNFGVPNQLFSILDVDIPGSLLIDMPWC